MVKNKEESGGEKFGLELDQVLSSVGELESVAYLEIQRKTGLHGAALDDALNRLERSGLIKSRDVQGIVHYWKPAETQAQKWYTVDEAAQYLRVSRRTIYINW